MSASYTVHDLGDVVRVRATFTINEILTDPSAVFVKIKPPSGTVTTYEYGVDDVIRESAGIYYFDIDANEVGWWWYRWLSTGTGQAAAERKFQVRTAVCIP